MLVAAGMGTSPEKEALVLELVVADKWTSPESEVLVLELVVAGKGTSPEGEVLELSVDPADSRQGPTQDSAVHQASHVLLGWSWCPERVLQCVCGCQ